MKYTIQFNGQVAGTRKSDRTYTHAVVSFKDGVSTVRCYNGSYDLAVKASQKYQSALLLCIKKDVKNPGYGREGLTAADAGATFHVVAVEVA